MSDPIKRVLRLKPEPGDLIVIEMQKPVTADMASQMKTLLEERFPDQRHLVVLDGALGLFREVA